MTRYLGDQTALFFAYESGTYNTIDVSGQWIGLVSDYTPDESVNMYELRYLGTNTRNVDLMIHGPRDYTASFTYHPQDWKFLTFALGSCVDGGSPSPYTHTISELDSDASSIYHAYFPSFQLEDAHVTATGSNFVRTLKGCMLNSMTIGGAQGEIMTCDMDVIAQNLTFSSGAAPSGTHSTLRPFLWGDCKVYLPSGTDTALPNVKNFSITINNNIEAPHYLDGTIVIGVPVPLNRDYEVSMTLDADDAWTKDFYDKYFLGGSEFNLYFGVSVGTGSSRDAYFTFSGCKIIDMDAPTLREGMAEQSLTIKPEACSVIINDSIQYYNAGSFS